MRSPPERAEEGAIGVVERGVREEVRPRRERRAQRLLPAPARDRGVVAGEEDVRDAQPAELLGARVLRVLEEPAAERVLERGALVAERTREESHDGVHDDESGGL